MGNEVHLYTLGIDPYVLQMGDVSFYIHQGQPSSTTPPATPPTGTPPLIYKQTKLRGPYENYIFAPRHAKDLGLILEAQNADTIDLGVALGYDEVSDTSTGDQLRALLDGLSHYDAADVSVHVVGLDALGAQHGDG